ncbi:hypothetical protein BY996DRAFT_558716 [Phakopsora pachyrhizi]|nr:hypothetical protein BY996DRAFT_558716 [Phakopsora pachyrhizi]
MMMINSNSKSEELGNISRGSRNSPADDRSVANTSTNSDLLLSQSIGSILDPWASPIEPQSDQLIHLTASAVQNLSQNLPQSNRRPTLYRSTSTISSHPLKLSPSNLSANEQPIQDQQKRIRPSIWFGRTISNSNTTNINTSVSSNKGKERASSTSIPSSSASSNNTLSSPSPSSSSSPSSSTPRQAVPLSENVNRIKGLRDVLIHRVEKTDTLAGIALSYGINVSALRKANGMWTNDPLSLKEMLRIPLECCNLPPSKKIEIESDSGKVILWENSNSNNNGSSTKNSNHQSPRTSTSTQKSNHSSIISQEEPRVIGSLQRITLSNDQRLDPFNQSSRSCGSPQLVARVSSDPNSSSNTHSNSDSCRLRKTLLQSPVSSETLIPELNLSNRQEQQNLKISGSSSTPSLLRQRSRSNNPNSDLKRRSARNRTLNGEDEDGDGSIESLINRRGDSNSRALSPINVTPTNSLRDLNRCNSDGHDDGDNDGREDSPGVEKKRLIGRFDGARINQFQAQDNHYNFENLLGNGSGPVNNKWTTVRPGKPPPLNKQLKFLEEGTSRTSLRIGKVFENAINGIFWSNSPSNISTAPRSDSNVDGINRSVDLQSLISVEDDKYKRSRSGDQKRKNPMFTNGHQSLSFGGSLEDHNLSDSHRLDELG